MEWTVWESVTCCCVRGQVLFTDSLGQAQASIAIPSGPSITDQRLWFVGIAGPGLPLQSTPVIGGVL